MSSEFQECNICASEQKNFICCQVCNFNVCKPCVQTFLLSKSKAFCMNCKSEWSTIFVRSNFTIDWIEKVYKVHLKKILYDQERNYFPETSNNMELYRKWKFLNEGGESEEATIFKKQLDEIKKEIRILKKLKQQFRRNKPKGGSNKNWLYNYAFPNWEEYNAAYYEIEHKLSDLKNEEKFIALSIFDKVNIISSRNNFIKKCPTEKCKGYLDENCLCRVCNTKLCSQCYQVEKDDHKCKADDIATINLLKQDTKPCPKCGIGVHKIAACDHMWCTGCNSGFDWQTGLPLDDSKNTNTLMHDFYKIKSKELQNFNGQVTALFKKQTTRNDKTIFILSIIENIHFLLNKFAEQRRLDFNLQTKFNIGEHLEYDFKTNALNRYKYLNNEIDEKHFLTQAMKKQKAIEFDKELKNLVLKFIEDCKNWCLQLFDEVRQKNDFYIKYINQIIKIINEFNTNSNHLSKIFGYSINKYIRFRDCENSIGQIKKLLDGIKHSERTDENSDAPDVPTQAYKIMSHGKNFENRFIIQTKKVSEMVEPFLEDSE